MAFILADRVKETATNVGTASAFNLGGAGTSFVAFGSVMSDGDQTYYAAIDYNNGDWEIGLGQYGLSGNVLYRTTVIQSSNADARVDWQSGTKYVFITYPADKSVHLDSNGYINKSDFGALNLTTSGNISATGAGTVSGANINDTAWDAHIALTNQHIDWTSNTAYTFNTTAAMYVDNVYFMNDSLDVDNQFYVRVLSSVSPAINFDLNAYLQYDRSASKFRFVVDSASQFELNATTADFFGNDIQTTADITTTLGDVSGNTIGGITEANLVDKTADETISGNWTFSGTQTSTGLKIDPADSSITAYAGGGQTNAYQLTENYNRVSTCATAGDSVKLPDAVAGYRITVINDGVNSCDVYPFSGDLIDGQPTNDPVALAAGANATYYAVSASYWVTLT